MSEYTELLILSYFKQYDKNYSITELMRLVGLNAEQMNNILEILIYSNYLTYDNYLLSITEKGLIRLTASNLSQFNFNDKDYIISDIEKSKALPIDFPYVPEDFDKKI